MTTMGMPDAARRSGGKFRNELLSFFIAVFVLTGNALSRLTRHKISDREPDKARLAAKGWMANTFDVNRSAARGSLHPLVRRLVSAHIFRDRKTSGASLSSRKHRAGFLDPASMCLRLFG